MKSADMLKTVERFIPFRVSSLIITKMDETEVYGNVISTAAECALPIAYLSYGQKVPQDLTRASVSSFLRELKGFTADLEHLPPDGR
jgi:flagellar biosynthesis protein FlhF